MSKARLTILLAVIGLIVSSGVATSYQTAQACNNPPCPRCQPNGNC